MTRLVSGSPHESPDPRDRLASERTRRPRTWLKLLVALLILGVVISLPWADGDQEVVAAKPVRLAEMQSNTFQNIAFNGPVLPEQALGAQTYLDGLTVEEGMVLAGDVTVWSGDAVVKEGGRIEGSLVAYAGDVKVREGGLVQGDITAWSGDVEIDGRVDGNVSALAGDVELDDNAFVGGDVSTLSGKIRKDDDASVGGTVLRGDSINLPFANSPGVAPIAPIAPAAPSAPQAAGAAAPDAPSVPPAPAEPVERGRNDGGGFNPVGSFFALIGRLFAAIFFTVIGLLMAMAVYSMRPALIDEVQDQMRLNLTRSFAVGLVTNGALYIVMSLLIWGFCTTPLAVVPALGLLALNAVAFTAIARSVGQRFLPAVRANVERKPVTEVALGALLVFGLLLVLSAIFGWGSFWTVVALVVAAPGVGAIVEPWMTRYRNRNVQDLTSPGATPPTSPAARRTPPVAPSAPAAVVSPVGPIAPMAPVQPPAPPAASSIPGQTILLAAVEPAPEPVAPVDLAAVQSDDPAAASAPDVSPDLGALDEPAVANGGGDFDFSLPQAEQPAYQADPTLSVEDLVAAADADAALQQDAASRAAQAALAAVDTSRGDDFTRIRGLGRAAERKLKGAGIYTFAELAALPVEIVARVLGVPAEEVIEDQIPQQANLLVRGRTL